MYFRYKLKKPSTLLIVQTNGFADFNGLEEKPQPKGKKLDQFQPRTKKRGRPNQAELIVGESNGTDIVGELAEPRFSLFLLVIFM
jgi:hypothetical protein